MQLLLARFWNDDGGAIIAIEWIFFVVIVLVGMVVGFIAIRNAVVDELTAVANAMDGLAICYSFAGLSNCESSVCGSQTIDVTAGASNIKAAKFAAGNTVVINHNPCQ